MALTFLSPAVKKKKKTTFQWYQVYGIKYVRKYTNTHVIVFDLSH